MIKRHLTLLMLLTACITLHAQETNLKFGINYAGQSQKLGFQVGALYGLTEEIDLAGGVSLFMPDKTTILGTDVSTFLWMLDLDGHYKFDMGDGFVIYPLAGLNFTGARVKSGGNTNSNTEIGINFGGGANYPLGEGMTAFGELKYIAGNADQAVFGLGIQIKI